MIWQYARILYSHWKILLLFYFWLCWAACRILVPQQWIEPEPQQWKLKILNPRPPKKPLKLILKDIFKISHKNTHEIIWGLEAAGCRTASRVITTSWLYMNFGSQCHLHTRHELIFISLYKGDIPYYPILQMRNLWLSSLLQINQKEARSGR